MRISMGHGGWFKLADLEGFSGPVYLRMQEVDGRLRVTELYVDGRGEPIQPGAVRRIPFGALEASGALDVEDPRFQDRLTDAGPDLSRLASYYSSTFGARERHWIADAYWAQFKDSDRVQPPYARKEGEERAAPGEVVLSMPENGLTDEFLADVARAYAVAVQQGRPPARALAEAAGLIDSNMTTEQAKPGRRLVESWIYKARKRGLMPPAPRRGRII